MVLWNGIPHPGVGLARKLRYDLGTYDMRAAPVGAEVAFEQFASVQ